MEVNFFISRDGNVPKRKHTRAACDACRKRKKRCRHGRTNQSPDFLSSPGENNEFVQYSPDDSSNIRPSVRFPASRQEPDLSNREPPPQNKQSAARLRLSQRRNVPEHARGGSQTGRFIGDLNPVMFFVDNTGTRLFRGRADQRDCGIWLDGDNDILVSGEEDVSSANHTSRNRVLTQVCPLLPPRLTQERLVDIYLRRIHPILPLIDEDDFRVRYNEGSHSPYLLQAICLVAAKDHEAEPFLRLPNHTGTLTPLEFSNFLYNDLGHTIAMKLERNRLTLIQLHMLLSLHVSGPDSCEEASLHLAQSFHNVCTVGLHLTKSGPTQHNKQSIRLFWCLWSLDRWNAAMQGRPLIIHDRDIGQQIVDVIELFEGPSRVFLSLTATLSEVFVVYRPVLEAPVDENKPEIPRFENILDQCGGWDMALDNILFLELAYHAIALLASRPWGLKAQPRSHTLYLRQDLSVYRLATLTQMCDARKMVPLPMVPYSLSLGFSISYKQTKRCQLPSTQHTSKQHIQAFYKSLEALCPTWWGARVMTRVGRCAFSGIQRMGERANGQAPPNPPARASCMDIAASTGCTGAESLWLATGLDSRTRVSDEIEGVRGQQQPANGTGTTKNHQVSFGLGDMGNGIWSDPAADPSFDDIDNILADFLNINIPTGPSYPSFNGPDMAWNSEGLSSS